MQAPTTLDGSFVRASYSMCCGQYSPSDLHDRGLNGIRPRKTRGDFLQCSQITHLFSFTIMAQGIVAYPSAELCFVFLTRATQAG